LSATRCCSTASWCTPGARVETAILDEDVQVRGGAVIGADIGRRTARDADIVLVGKGSRIGRKVTIGKGARLEPGTSA
jgi:glucose-1-phosphate adenylyltransferase